MLVRPYVVKPVVSPLGPQTQIRYATSYVPLSTAQAMLSPRNASPRNSAAVAGKVPPSPRSVNISQKLPIDASQSSQDNSTSGLNLTSKNKEDEATQNAKKAEEQAPAEKKAGEASRETPSPARTPIDDAKCNAMQTSQLEVTNRLTLEDKEIKRRQLETKLFDLLHGLDTRLRAVPNHVSFWKEVDNLRAIFDRMWEEGQHSYLSFHNGLVKLRTGAHISWDKTNKLLTL